MLCIYAGPLLLVVIWSDCRQTLEKVRGCLQSFSFSGVKNDKRHQGKLLDAFCRQSNFFNLLFTFFCLVYLLYGLR